MILEEPFAVFWEEFHERIEHACAVDTYGDPTTDRDNKAPISSRAMRVVSSEVWEIIQEQLELQARSAGRIEGEENPAI